MNILITGGAGFIGSSLAIRLVELGYKVRVLDNLSPQIHGDDPQQSPLFLSLPREVEFIHGSVLARQDIARALSDVDCVVHLAAETGTGQSMYAIKHYTDVNIGGTSILLEEIAERRESITKVIVASSRAIYGEGDYLCSVHGRVFPGQRSDQEMQVGDFHVHCPFCGGLCQTIPTREDSPPRPASVYAISKLSQEQLVMNIAPALGLSAYALRFQNVYGPGQSLSNPYTGILSIFSTRILNGSYINIFEDGKESRDFVYISDVVTSLVACIERNTVACGIFNIGSGSAVSVYEVATKLQEHYGKKVQLKVTGQYRVGDIRHCMADISLAQEKLGFNPAVRIEHGLEQFVTWVKGEKVQHDGYEHSLEELRDKGLFK